MNEVAVSDVPSSHSRAEASVAGFPSARLQREWRTVDAMIRCYCHDVHGREGALCPHCEGLLQYASVRLQRCRFGAQKPTCAKCPVHCYQKDHREQIRVVMRYAGPRMLWKHPLLALRHWMTVSAFANKRFEG